MAVISIRAESWEYDDVANTVTGVFVDQPSADDLDPVNYRSSVRVIAVFPLSGAAVTPPNIRRRRI